MTDFWSKGPTTTELRYLICACFRHYCWLLRRGPQGLVRSDCSVLVQVEPTDQSEPSHRLLLAPLHPVLPTAPKLHEKGRLFQRSVEAFGRKCFGKTVRPKRQSGSDQEKDRRHSHSCALPRHLFQDSGVSIYIGGGLAWSPRPPSAKVFSLSLLRPCGSEL